MAAPRGRVLFFGGLPKGTSHISFPSNMLHYREVQVHGSYASRHRDQVRALDMLAADAGGICSVVSDVIGLDEAPDAFDRDPRGRRAEGRRRAVTTSRRGLRFSLAEELRGRIVAGEWGPGDRLPSEPELARLRAVSRSSMRAAITLLEEEGFVSRTHGSGTYVTHRPVLVYGSRAQLRRVGADRDDRPRARDGRGDRESRAGAGGRGRGARRGGGRAGERAAPRAHGGRAPGRRLLRLVPDRAPRAGGAAAGRLDVRGAGRARLAVEHGVAYLTPRNADGEIARRLDVPRGTLLLTIDQIDSTADGMVVLFSREHHVADAFTFSVLRRGPGASEEERT